MKKKSLLVIGIVGIIIIVIVTLKYNPIYNIYKEKKIIKNNINFLNGKSFDGIMSQGIEQYNRLKTPIEDLNHYDITEIVEKYIELVMLRKNNNGIEDKEGSRIRYMKNYNEKDKYTYGKDIKMKYDYNIQYYINNISEEYTKNMLISELKNILDYEEKNGKIKWMINDIEEKNIELPFNCYFKYTPYYRKLNTEFDEVLNIKFKEGSDLNDNLNNVFVEYKTKNGSIKTIETEMYKAKDNKHYLCSLYGILYIDGDHIAQIELRNHDIDRIKDEHKKLVDELQNKFMHEEMEAGLR